MNKNALMRFVLAVYLIAACLCVGVGVIIGAIVF